MAVVVKTEDIVKLRERTGAGIMDCKKALIEAENDLDKACDLLRELGVAKAAKKANRIAAEGVVHSYIHMGGKIGVLLEVNCETDFVARSDAFMDLVKDLALQIAASAPKYVAKEEVPSNEIEKEKEVLRATAINEGKPEKILDRIVEGGINKLYGEICLLEQNFIKDPSKKVLDVVNEAVAKIGEKINVRRFVRYEMGEGLEKRNDDFASEVMSQMSK